MHPISNRGMGTKSETMSLSGHLFASLLVGNARRSRLVLNYRITVSGSPDLIIYLVKCAIIFILLSKANNESNLINNYIFYRSLLLFAKGKPLGKRGFEWLKTHCINLTELKKKSIEPIHTSSHGILQNQ